MTAGQPFRQPSQRVRDLFARLDSDVDLWVASADTAGNPYLVPLSFLWDGASFVVSTLETNPTGRNMLENRKVRLGLGPTRDVAVIDATVEPLPRDAVPEQLADAFARKAGFDPRAQPQPYVYYRLVPHRVEAWREANELSGRVLMRDGRWLAGGSAPAGSDA
ncbi:MAG: pyridoxamine 5'-phosphate oxidase family protein [Mycobacteriales bacterium]